MDKILVVDDEVQVVNLLKKYLDSKGYEVYTATNGQEAISKVREVTPHIVLLDIIMPGMGGMDALQEIKKVNPKFAVIMLTAVIDEELAKRAIQLGADDYITKPFNLENLEAVLMVKIIQLFW
jgi:DNA-binding response OmpR family regulator